MPTLHWITECIFRLEKLYLPELEFVSFVYRTQIQNLGRIFVSESTGHDRDTHHSWQETSFAESKA